MPSISPTGYRSFSETAGYHDHCFSLVVPSRSNWCWMHWTYVCSDPPPIRRPIRLENLVRGGVFVHAA